MKKILTTAWLCASLFAVAQKTKMEVAKAIDSKYDQYSVTAKKIWDFAEVGFQETQSSALLQQTLKDAGFTIQANVAGMPTAFTATYGSGKPLIGILGEYVGRIYEEVKRRPLYLVADAVNTQRDDDE